MTGKIRNEMNKYINDWSISKAFLEYVRLIEDIDIFILHELRNCANYIKTSCP